MAQLQLRTEEDALRDMVNRVVARTDLSDITDASSFKQLLRAVATELGEAYFQLSIVALLNDINLAAGTDLEELAKKIVPGTLQRFGPRKAVGKQIFIRATNDFTTKFVAAGTIVQTADGQRYVTMEQGSVTGTSPEQIPGHGVGRDTPPVVAQAISAGAAGDAGTDTVNQLVARPAGFVETTYTSAYLGGRDRESDDQFRSRIRSYVESLSRCTVGAIESITFGIRDEGSGKQVVFNKVVEDQVLRGNVTLYIDDGAGTAADRVEAAPSGVLTSVTGPGGAGTYTAIAFEAEIRGELDGRAVTVSGSGNTANNGTFVGTVLDDSTFTYYNPNAGATVADPPTLYQWAAEVVLSPALGQEEFLRLDHWPVDLDQGVEITSGGVPGRGLLVVGSEVYVNPATGLLFFDPPLAAGEIITARYQYFTNLVALVQRVVDGDPDDRANFPGIRAAGVLVRVLPPVTRIINVEAVLNVLEGFDRAEVIANVRTAIDTYINNAGISADIIRHELVERIMGVTGMYDVDLVEPANNINILDNEIPRTTATSVSVT
jgi:uncharacterized phage protein gp47/JayE